MITKSLNLHVSFLGWVSQFGFASRVEDMGCNKWAEADLSYLLGILVFCGWPSGVSPGGIPCLGKAYRLRCPRNAWSFHPSQHSQALTR